jgi:competence protein ComEA
MPVIALSRSHVLVLALALVALLAIAGKRLAGAGATQPPRVAAAPEPVVVGALRRRLVVHVAGAVRRPGLYRLREGARIADAVARAGGAARRAELSAVNLAAPLVDGAQVLVPLRGPAGSPPGGEPAAAGPVSLGSATVEQLDELPGVGPVTAQKIVDYRAEHGPFRSVDDLDAIPGIGPARLEQIRDLVTP